MSVVGPHVLKNHQASSALELAVLPNHSGVEPTANRDTPTPTSGDTDLVTVRAQVDFWPEQLGGVGELQSCFHSFLSRD